MDPATVTGLLQRVERGDEDAADELYTVLYADLRERAGRLLGPGPEATIQATALVNEAWLKLRSPSAEAWKSRAHFLGVAAKAMRSVLVDHARAKGTRKRGGKRRVLLDQAVAVYEERAIDLAALNEGLEQLAALDERLSKVVELRFFGGLSIEEAAVALGVSEATVSRRWTTARAWLHSTLTGGAADGP